MQISSNYFYFCPKNISHRLAMLLFQHARFCSRILIALLILTVVLYFYLNIKAMTKYSLADPSAELEKRGKTSKFFRKMANKTRKTVYINPRQANGNVYLYGNGDAEIKVAVVLCGERLNQTVVTLKSVVILSRTPLHFIIVADEENRNNMKNKLLSWPSSVLSQLSFEIHPISFPNGSDGEEWKKLFKLCACQRLFLPSLLEHIDSLIYIDTDVLFMHPVEDLWQYFYQMNNSQIAGLAPEHEDFATGWYNRFARHPFYEPLGVNSGVMLMNLTRMRAFRWETYLQPVMREYKLKIVWGDQDIINIIFHFHPEKMFIFPCEWNYRPDHCMYSSVCKTAEEHGVKVIHGNRGVYQKNKQPVFKAIYEAMENFQIGSNLQKGLLEPMKAKILQSMDNSCGKLHKILIKSLEQYILQTQIKSR